MNVIVMLEYAGDDGITNAEALELANDLASNVHLDIFRDPAPEQYEVLTEEHDLTEEQDGMIRIEARYQVAEATL